MSYVHVSSTADVARRVEYLVVGTGEKKAEHLANGTDRIAAMTNEIGSLADFVREAQWRAETNGRGREAYTYIQSFDSDEFNPSDPHAVEAVHALGVELSNRMHPNSPCLVITHTDGCGGHPHNHIVVINHDYVTGRSVQHHKTHDVVASANDKLMRERGLSTISNRELHWPDRAEELEPGSFDWLLGNRVWEARNKACSMDEFVNLLEADGVGVEFHEIEGASQKGITYRMSDPTSIRRKAPRRRTASKLGALDFVAIALTEAFEVNTIQRDLNLRVSQQFEEDEEDERRRAIEEELAGDVPLSRARELMDELRDVDERDRGAGGYQFA